MQSPRRPLPEPIPPDLLLLAYRAGIFPMSDHRDDAEIFWVEPRERAVIPLDGFRLSRSLAKTIAQDRFRVTCNRAFGEVIAACAAPREEDAESWISHRIEASYAALHQLGHAHSIECWEATPSGEERLAGGLYGVAFDRVFCGESMFSWKPNASKVALAALVAGLRRGGFAVLDCQFMTAHLASLGAVAWPQRDYLALLADARGAPDRSLPQAMASLVGDGVGVGVGEAEGGSVRAARPAAGVATPAGSASSPGKRILQSLTQTS